MFMLLGIFTDGVNMSPLVNVDKSFLNSHILSELRIETAMHHLGNANRSTSTLAPIPSSSSH